MDNASIRITVSNSRLRLKCAQMKNFNRPTQLFGNLLATLVDQHPSLMNGRQTTDYNDSNFEILNSYSKDRR